MNTEVNTIEIKERNRVIQSKITISYFKENDKILVAHCEVQDTIKK